MNSLLGDLKDVFSNVKVVAPIVSKFIKSWMKYAQTKKNWKEIGYYGPRPDINSKLYNPPDEIIEKQIVMECMNREAPTARPPKKPIGETPANPEEKFHKSPFHNYQYEKQMEKTNHQLRKRIKTIKKYPKNQEVDICIIGSGPGGTALAHTLQSQMKDKKIVVLEQGKLFLSEDFNQKERTMTPRLYRLRFSDDFGMGFYQSSVVGGSAVVNDAICFELPDEISQTWDHDINKDLKEGGYYEKVRDMIHYKELDIMTIDKNTRMYRKGVEKLGKMDHYSPLSKNLHPRLESDPDSSFTSEHAHQLTCVGCGFCYIGCKYDRKLTPVLTYIPAAIKEGVEFYKQAKVKKILFKKENGKNKITGVRVKRGFLRKDLTIKAKIVVVACGAVNSAQFLKKSGVENKFLGKNISLHPSAQVYALFDEDIYGDWGMPMCGGYEEFHFPKNNPDFPDGVGYMIESVFNHPQGTAFSFPKKKMTERMKDYKRLSKVGVMMRGNSDGELVAGSDSLAPIRYKLTEVEKEKLRHGIRTAAETFLAAGAKEVWTNHEKELLFRPDHKEEDLDKSKKFPMDPDDILLLTGHPQGGCKMGKEGNGVVDYNGHSYDVDNLFVSDASLFPTSLSVNPQVTIMAMATKIGDHIAKEFDKYTKPEPS